MSDTVRAIIYTRVSTRDQGESGLGLEDQRRKALAYCVAKGYVIDERNDIYEDSGFSGTKLDRPALNAVRERITDPDVDVVVVPMMSRLTRRVKHLLMLVDEINEVCNIAFVQEGCDTRTPMGEAVMTMMAAMNQLEVRQIQQRTRDALAVQRSKGLRSAGRPPYGFLPLESGGWMVVPSQIEWLEYVFELRYCQGYGWRAIAKALDLQGFRGFSLDPSAIAQRVKAKSSGHYVGLFKMEVRSACQRAGVQPVPMPEGSLLEYDPDAVLADGEKAGVLRDRVPVLAT